jgi:hypothetical protein
MFDVAPPPGEEIVGDNDFVAARQQTIAEMRAEKARAAGDENSAWILHEIAPLSGVGDRVGVCRR